MRGTRRASCSRNHTGARPTHSPTPNSVVQGRVEKGAYRYCMCVCTHIHGVVTEGYMDVAGKEWGLSVALIDLHSTLSATSRLGAAYVIASPCATIYAPAMRSASSRTSARRPSHHRS